MMASDLNDGRRSASGEVSGGPGPNIQPAVRRKARRFLRRLPPAERESLIIKCWMSHDARWFMAAATTFGLEAALHLNRMAVRDEGRAEARRLVRRLQLPAVQTVSDYLLIQEVIIGLLGPELLEYALTESGEDGFELQIQRCFAFDNVSRAGIAGHYECGILPRVMGWLDELGVDYSLTPEPIRCLKAQGRECSYTVRFASGGAADAPSGRYPVTAAGGA